MLHVCRFRVVCLDNPRCRPPLRVFPVREPPYVQLVAFSITTIKKSDKKEDTIMTMQLGDMATVFLAGNYMVYDLL